MNQLTDTRKTEASFQAIAFSMNPSHVLSLVASVSRDRNQMIDLNRLRELQSAEIAMSWPLRVDDDFWHRRDSVSLAPLMGKVSAGILRTLRAAKLPTLPSRIEITATNLASASDRTSFRSSLELLGTLAGAESSALLPSDGDFADWTCQGMHALV